MYEYLSKIKVETILLILTFIVTFFAAFSRIKNFFKAFWKMLKNTYMFVNKINEIHSQFASNGGKSLKDSLDRIEKQITTLNFRIDGLSGILKVNNLDSRYGIFQLNSLGELIWINTAYGKVVGIDNETEILGLGWISKILPDDRDNIRTEINSSIRDLRPIDIEYITMDKDMNPNKVKVHAIPNNTYIADRICYIGTIERAKK